MGDHLCPDGSRYERQKTAKIGPGRNQLFIRIAEPNAKFGLCKERSIVMDARSMGNAFSFVSIGNLY